jgi:hypothetical protein
MKEKFKILKTSPVYAMSLGSHELFHSNFWAWMMDNHPKIFHWCDKYLPFNTLPF